MQFFCFHNCFYIINYQGYTNRKIEPHKINNYLGWLYLFVECMNKMFLFKKLEISYLQKSFERFVE